MHHSVVLFLVGSFNYPPYHKTALELFPVAEKEICCLFSVLFDASTERIRFTLLLPPVKVFSSNYGWHLGGALTCSSLERTCALLALASSYLLKPTFQHVCSTIGIYPFYYILGGKYFPMIFLHLMNSSHGSNLIH